MEKRKSCTEFTEQHSELCARRVCVCSPDFLPLLTLLRGVRSVQRRSHSSAGTLGADPRYPAAAVGHRSLAPPQGPWAQDWRASALGQQGGEGRLESAPGVKAKVVPWVETAHLGDGEI